MKVISRQTLVNRVLTGSLLFYAISGATSLINYIFYPIVARLVSTADYGEVQFLVSMFTQLAVGFVVLNILAIIISVRAQSPENRHRDINTLNSVSTVIIFIIVAIGSLVLYASRNELGISSGWSLAALSAALIINVPFTVRIGQLQGDGHFVASGILSIIASLSKLLFAILFLTLGLGVPGVMMGIGVGMAFSLVTSFLMARTPPAKQNILSKVQPKHLNHIKETAIVATLAVTTVTLLSTIDVIIARIFLSPVEAGQYAAVATVAKTILAATSPIAWLALPPSVKKQAGIVIKYIQIALLTSSVLGLLFIVWPHQIVEILLNINAGEFINYIGLSTVAMIIYGIAFIAVTSALCLDHLNTVRRFSLFALAGYVTVLYILLQLGYSPIYATLLAQIFAGISLTLPAIHKIIMARQI